MEFSARGLVLAERTVGEWDKSLTLLCEGIGKTKAVRASVTISEVDAKSSPEAAARFIMPSIPLNISLVFQPAIAI